MDLIKISLPFTLSILLIIVSFHFQTRIIMDHFKQFKTVSHMYRRPFARSSFRVGLILTGILQVLFVLSFSFTTNQGYELGRILFIFGAIGGILLGLFSLDEQMKIHLIASYQYFFGLAIGALLITLNIPLPALLILMLILIILLWLFVIFIELPKFHGVYAIETFHVLLSYGWILIISMGHILFVVG